MYLPKEIQWQCAMQHPSFFCAIRRFFIKNLAGSRRNALYIVTIIIWDKVSTEKVKMSLMMRSDWQAVPLQRAFVSSCNRVISNAPHKTEEQGIRWEPIDTIGYLRQQPVSHYPISMLTSRYRKDEEQISTACFGKSYTNHREMRKRGRASTIWDLKNATIAFVFSENIKDIHRDTMTFFILSEIKNSLFGFLVHDPK